MSKIIIFGCGGTGCHVLELLSKTNHDLTIIDRDVVEESNIQRQILFDKQDIGKPKVIAAKEKLGDNVKIKFEDINPDTIYFNADLVIDCTDNIETRLIINDYCKSKKIPWIYSGAIKNIGSIYFNSPEGPCFQCFNATKYGETCNDAGVLNSTLSKVGSLVAKMAIDYLDTGLVEKDLIRIQDDKVFKIKVSKNAECECCKGNYKYLEGKAVKKILKCCSSQHYQFSVKLDLNEIRKRLKDFKDLGEFIKYKNIFITKNRVLIKAESEIQAKKKYDEVIGI